MADTTSTHLSMLLDRSGSMQSIKAATIAGFDEFMLEQRGVTGRCTVTLAQFDSDYEEVYADRDIATVPSLDLQPRGTTALLDSIARLVHSTSVRLAQLPEDQRPATVIVGIMTDGHENASKEYTHAAIKTLVTERETEFGWTFLYMGANQDAIEVGESIGVSRERSLTYEGASAGAAYGAASASMARLRTGVADGAAPSAARDAFAGFATEERDRAAGDGKPAGGAHPARRVPVVTGPAGPPDVPTVRLTERELVAWLTQWRDTTSATSIGDRKTYGGRKLIDAQVAGRDVFLNADTSRDAVEQLLAHAARGPLVWSTIRNRNGIVNKITFQPDGARTPGWYCYLTAAQAGEGQL